MKIPIDDPDDIYVAICEWTWDQSHDYYETTCKHSFCFNDGKKEDMFKYCPYCGDWIKADQ